MFRVRTGRIAESELLSRLADRGFRTFPLDGMPGFHQVVDGPVAVSMTPEHWLGLLYVQQASTGVAAPAIGPRPGEHVLDLCSAPGGKTTHMADLMNDSGCLVASEISEPRIRGLLGNVYRLAHPNIMVVAGDGREFPEGATFDRVLVDAPCSGEGTLRRRGGQAPNQSPSFVSYVTGAQRDLLERAVRVTRPGGIILYVTCTFAPEENEAVVSDALERLPVELEPLDLPVPHARGVTAFEGVTFDPRVEGAARIYPHHLDSGGLFLARLRKLDDGLGNHGLRNDGSGDDGPGHDGLGNDGEGRSGGGGSGPGSTGRVGPIWTPVPLVFPGDDLADDTANTMLASALADLSDRYGVREGLDHLKWIFRGGRLWVHTLDAWPLPAWAEGGWRSISTGIRAIDFDTQGRPRPTNDLLRLLGAAVAARAIDLDDGEAAALLRRETVPTSIDDRGPVALRYRGDTLGRGAVTVDGLKSEIPKARAADYRRILDAETSA